MIKPWIGYRNEKLSFSGIYLLLFLIGAGFLLVSFLMMIQDFYVNNDYIANYIQTRLFYNILGLVILVIGIFIGLKKKAEYL
jgi:hypothetical protein